MFLVIFVKLTVYKLSPIWREVYQQTLQIDQLLSKVNNIGGVKQKINCYRMLTIGAISIVIALLNGHLKVK